jgi:hypothetical protein
LFNQSARPVGRSDDQAPWRIRARRLEGRDEARAHPAAGVEALDPEVINQAEAAGVVQDGDVESAVRAGFVANRLPGAAQGYWDPLQEPLAADLS